MKAKESHDIVVIGGGSGGHAAAQTASDLGLKVALVENAEKLGGLCILRGCMPSKTLIETANRLRDIREARTFAIDAGAAVLDVDALRARVERLVGEFQNYRVKSMNSDSYKLIRGTARFTSPHEIEVDGYGKIEASAMIIATGSHPMIPKLPGLEGTPFWTSDDVVKFPKLPRKIAIVGSGAIGMECAHLFEGLGSEVTVIIRGNAVMGQSDPEIGNTIEAASRERGITFLKNTEVARVDHDGDLFHLDLDGADAIEVDALLIATGRNPSTSGLGLDEIGVATEKGRIVIDERTATSLPHIFAAGDCASPVPVVHLAVIQGEVAAKNAARVIGNNHLDAAEEWCKESAMLGWFTEPQSVQIGLAEHQVGEREVKILVGKEDYSDHGKGIIMGVKHGFVKVIADAESGRLLGAAGVGPQVVETAHLLQAAISQGHTAGEYLKIPHYHPTLAEAWSRAVEAIQEQLGDD